LANLIKITPKRNSISATLSLSPEATDAYTKVATTRSLSYVTFAIVGSSLVVDKIGGTRDRFYEYQLWTKKFLLKFWTIFHVNTADINLSQYYRQ
jgi:hypothetical protein